MNRRKAFTLIELLVVIAVIGILVSLLFPALNGALDKARRTAALTEIKSLETALKKYYQEYTTWPTVANNAEANVLEIKGEVVRILLGDNVPDNPKRMPFMEFSRLNTDGNPVNPWGSKSASQNTQKHFYYAKVDVDFDNRIPLSAGAPPNDQPRTEVRASVLVWTYNPKKPVESPDHVIASWSR